MRRWECEIRRCRTTDERLRDIIALERVLFLNFQDVELVIYPGLKRNNRLSIDPICIYKILISWTKIP